jgi:GT2 family glycosyltransferase
VKGEPSVCALTLNWNRSQDTVECLDTLARQTYPNLRLSVVDNGSSDDSITSIRTRFPQVDLVQSPENRGFAAGANLGLRRALDGGAEHVFLVNNDTLIDKQAVAHLVRHVGPGVGILAPAIFYAEDQDRIWSAGGRIHPLTLDKYHDTWQPAHAGGEAGPEDKDFVTGCGMLLTRQFLEEVGLFDERFFMYYEDADLCMRARRAGFRILLVPAAKMWHKVAQSSGGRDSLDERYWMGRSSVIYFRKHARGAQWLAILPWRAASAVRTTARLWRAGRREAAGAYWRGLRDGWRSN